LQYSERNEEVKEVPKVSVLIPSYNHEKYVAEAIQSVLDQTFQNFEIIITDDGSVDNTVDVIKSFSDTRIRLFVFEKNQGAVAAYTNCFNNANGLYMANLSSDDAWMPDKLEKQVKILDENLDVAAVFSQAHIVDDDGNHFDDKDHPYHQIFHQENRNRFQWLRRFFYEGNCLCHPSVLARREIYNPLLFDKRYIQLPDFDIWIKICLEHEIFIIQEKLIKFRIRTDEKNVSGNRPDSLILFHNETNYILRNYLKIDSTDTLLKIFPELENKKKSITNATIPYYIALQALLVKSRPYINFALNTLYEFIQHNEATIELSSEENFTIADYFKIVVESDLYNQFPYRSRLYLDTGNGFNEAEKMEIVVFTGRKEWKFVLEKYSGIVSIRFDPLGGNFCRFKIVKVETDGIYNGIAWSNARETSDGWDVFLTHNPNYVFKGDFTNATWIKIEGEIEILDNNIISDFFIRSNINLSQTRDGLSQAQSVLSQTQTKLSHIIDSRTWKWGNKIAGLLRFIVPPNTTRRKVIKKMLFIK